MHSGVAYLHVQDPNVKTLHPNLSLIVETILTYAGVPASTINLFSRICCSSLNCVNICLTSLLATTNQIIRGKCLHDTA